MGIFDGMGAPSPDPSQAFDATTALGDGSGLDMAKLQQLMKDPNFIKMVMQLGQQGKPLTQPQPTMAQQLQPAFNMLQKSGGIGGLGGLGGLLGGGTDAALGGLF